jgi:DNA-binding MarR family transcriptional regulator
MTTDPVLKPGVKPPYELICSTTFLLKRLGMAAKERSMEAYDAIGASPYHYSVLAVLEEGARDTQAKIADALGYDRSWLVGLLDELEEAGLIERKRDPEDRRRHLVSLNPAGKKRLAELRAVSKRVEDELLASLDAEERTQLHELLLQIAAEHDPRLAPVNGENSPASGR